MPDLSVYTIWDPAEPVKQRLTELTVTALEKILSIIIQLQEAFLLTGIIKKKEELFIVFVFRNTCLLFWTDQAFCFVLDPATKMWNFSLEDYQQLSKSIKQIFKRKCMFLYSSDITLIKGTKEVFLLVCVSLLGCSGGSSCRCLGVFEAS